MGSLELFSQVSGNSGLGCFSRKGTACLHSERNLKSVQWKRIDGGGEGSSGTGLTQVLGVGAGPGGWGRDLRFRPGQQDREAQEGSVPTSSRWSGTELPTHGGPG